MNLCRYFDDCQPEVIRNCCLNGGVWNDKRRKNHGERCGFIKQIEKRR
jgi:hypothetical protein